jgi:hypothetical protein
VVCDALDQARQHFLRGWFRLRCRARHRTIKP